jgi:hypothetical protein
MGMLRMERKTFYSRSSTLSVWTRVANKTLANVALDRRSGFSSLMQRAAPVGIYRQTGPGGPRPWSF